ncbi:hypothetical protein AgCh_039154 [Apium graveolens]
MNEITNVAINLRRNVGDSTVGPGLTELKPQISEIRHYRNGSPAASRAVVQVLPNVRISNEMIGSGVTNCAVCRERFCLGDLCKHSQRVELTQSSMHQVIQ